MTSSEALLSEARHGDSRAWTPQLWAILIVLGGALCLDALDVSMIGVALPFTVLTLGLGVLVLNGLVVWLVAEVAAGVTIDNVWTGIIVAIGLTVVGTLGTSLLAIDDDNFYDRNVIRRQARKHGAVETDVPALYLLEIDGLAHAVLMRAIRDGNAPTMARSTMLKSAWPPAATCSRNSISCSAVWRARNSPRAIRRTSGHSAWCWRSGGMAACIRCWPSCRG
jgi:uncharacterized membrane protein YvlD (DUF360 family)